MDIDEAEVWVSEDGSGRASIVRRSDGYFCIYVWPYLAVPVPIELLYEDPDHPELYKKPEPGIYGTAEDARHELKSLRGFSGAILKSSNYSPSASS